MFILKKPFQLRQNKEPHPVRCGTKVHFNINKMNYSKSNLTKMYSKVFQGFNFCLDSGVPQAKKKIYLPD